MDGVFIRHAACLLGSLLLCVLAPQKEIRALRKTCKMVRKDWRGKKYQKRDLMYTWSLSTNSRSTIQLTFSQYKSVSLPGLQMKKLAAIVAIIFSPAYRRVSKLVVRKRGWWGDEVEREGEKVKEVGTDDWSRRISGIVCKWPVILCDRN